jgi:hypothetical protein
VANENFTPEDHSWTVRYGFPADFTQWREFFGDEYNWTSMVPILWQSVDSPAARILPPKFVPHGFAIETCAWWNGALHLLAFGMGWVDLAKGLREWREGGYSRENSILRLLFDTYGSSIQALELWLNKGLINYSLGNTGDRQGATRLSPERLEDQRMRLLSMIASGPRHQLTRELLEGGGDTFHLSGHFPGSVGGPNDSPTIIDEDLFDQDMERRLLRVRLYRGWHKAVSEFLLDENRNLETTEITAAVLVSRIGYLGSYAVSPTTSRAYRRSPGNDVSRDHEFHMMGN